MNPIRDDFPILNQQVNGAPLTYLDSAATTQKPRAVIDAISRYYEHDNANVHRAAHALADRATQALEEARGKVARFINAATTREVIFTRGTTEAINLVAHGLAERLSPGDEILITVAEHHSNIVPWQLLANRTGAVLKAAPVLETGDIDIEAFQALISERTKIAAFGHVSNALGTVHPVMELVRLCRQASEALILIDGAQAALHIDVDVQALDADFYAFSSHKMFGPTGMGVLWGRAGLLEAMPPYQSGGEMIEHVSIDTVTFNELPYKFEAGTPHIAGAIGLGAAIDYLNNLPRDELKRDEDQLVAETIARLREMNSVRIVGEPAERLAVVSFNVEGSHPADLGTLLDQQGIAVRTGHHCAMPLMSHLCVPGTVRASFSLYNDQNDVDRLISGVHKALTFL